MFIFTIFIHCWGLRIKVVMVRPRKRFMNEDLIHEMEQPFDNDDKLM